MNRTALFASWHEAVTSQWWLALRTFLAELVQEYARACGACTACGHKNATKGIKECLSCFEPLAGHADSDADDSPIVEHVGFDG